MYPYANFTRLLNSRPIDVTHPKAYIFNEKFNHIVESYAITMKNQKKETIEIIAEKRSTCIQAEWNNNDNRELITGKAKRQKRMIKNSI